MDNAPQCQATTHTLDALFTKVVVFSGHFHTHTLIGTTYEKMLASQGRWFPSKRAQISRTLPLSTRRPLQEILEGLGAHQGGYFIDGTFGAGGHSLAILKAHPLNYVLAMDVDPGVQGFVEHVYHRCVPQWLCSFVCVCVGVFRFFSVCSPPPEVLPGSGPGWGAAGLNG